MAGLTERSELRLPPNPEDRLGRWTEIAGMAQLPDTAYHQPLSLVIQAAGSVGEFKGSTASGCQSPLLKATSDAAVCSEVAVLKSETGKVLPVPSDRGLVLWSDDLVLAGKLRILVQTTGLWTHHM